MLRWRDLTPTLPRMRPDPNDLQHLEARSRRFSQARLALGALLAAVLIAHLGYEALPGRLAWTMLAVGVATFLWVAVAHERHEQRRRREEARALLRREADARRARDWPALPHAAAAPLADAPDDFAAAALDLDFFGTASLRQLLGRTASPSGEQRLLAWLRDATQGAPSDLAARQAAVGELTPAAAHREALLVEGLAAGPLRPEAPEAFGRWLAAPPSVMAAPTLAAAVALIPLAAVALVLIDLAGGRVGGWWLAIVAASWTLRGALARVIGPAFAGADALSGEVRRYRALLAAWEVHPADTPWLRDRRARLVAPSPASTAFAALARLVDLSDLRWSHLPHVLVHSISGWDLHIACALERWRARHGQAVPGWFEAIADLDAAATLAGLADLEPGWNFPDVNRADPTCAARALAHPLLPAGRVANDLMVGPPGRVLVVTGSNMSGKSTLLRAIGLNVVLAQMGGPVCAASFAVPSLRLETSLRLTDSLAAGVSYFMAALLRLKAIVTAADEARATSGAPRVLYLLDEVLQGTNSEERHVAIRHIVRHLVGTPALGAITTHDLHLVHTPEFRHHADHVHFTERIDSDEAGAARVRFDYRLQPGPAQSRNALALVRLVGLGEVALESDEPVEAAGERPGSA